MKGNPFRGGGYLVRAVPMLLQPGLRTFVLLPLLVNVVLFIGAIWLLMDQFEYWMDYWMGQLPSWLSFIDWLLWPLFALVVLLVVYYSFTIVANLIAAPFNGLLAEKVEMRLRGEVNADTSWQAVLRIVPKAIARELSKLAYYLPRFLIILAITFVPLVNLAAPFLWFLFGAWMMAIQYCDYPMDNNRVSFKSMKAVLKSHRLTALGFGGLVQLGMLIPVINLILMPTAVVGATIYWVEEYADDVEALSDLR